MHYSFIFTIPSLLLCLNCQRQPAVSVAADPNTPKALAPMGSTTSNLQLEQKKLLLIKLLDGTSETELLKDPANKTILLNLYEIFPKESFSTNTPINGLQRDLFIAEFYFNERRFIEAAEMLSIILDQEPMFPRVRNLLSRCFYFLGNPDRAQVELDFILSSQNTNLDELLDALFLMGAIALESPFSSEAIITKGIRSWETYLKVAPKSTLREKVDIGLKELKNKQIENSTPKINFKVKNTANNTSDAKQQGLTAFAENDFLLAETKLNEYLQQNKNEPEASTALARIYIRSSRIPEALEVFKTTLKIHSNYAQAWHYQGMAFIMSGNPQKAVESWQKVIQIDPKYAAEFELQNRIAIAQGMAK